MGWVPPETPSEEPELVCTQGSGEENTPSLVFMMQFSSLLSPVLPRKVLFSPWRTALLSRKGISPLLWAKFGRARVSEWVKACNGVPNLAIGNVTS